MNNSSINILIGHADKIDALQLTDALKDILPSCNTIYTSDGNAVLRHIKTNATPDIVFLDLNMPFKNGIACLKDIYNNSLLPGIPIIIYSTTKNIKDINNAYQHGAAFYIIKPGSLTELGQIIRRAIFLLGRPQNERVDKASFVLREISTYNYI
jgi:DNA-binding NtrC family response regulator